MEKIASPIPTSLLLLSAVSSVIISKRDTIRGVPIRDLKYVHRYVYSLYQGGMDGRSKEENHVNPILFRKL